MRKRGSWMNSATEPLLEVLRKGQDWKSTPDMIVNMIYQFEDPPSQSTVYRSVNALMNHEYTGDKEYDSDTLIIAREFDEYGKYYRITDLGIAYLEGKIDGGKFVDVAE